MPNVIGSAMKLRKLVRTPTHAAAPSIHMTPANSVASTSAAPARLRASAMTRRATARIDAPVASGASCTIERIMAAKMTACPELRTTVPSSSGISPMMSAMRTRLRPSHTLTCSS